MTDHEAEIRRLAGDLHDARTRAKGLREMSTAHLSADERRVHAQEQAVADAEAHRIDLALMRAQSDYAWGKR